MSTGLGPDAAQRRELLAGAAAESRTQGGAGTGLLLFPIVSWCFLLFPIVSYCLLLFVDVVCVVDADAVVDVDDNC